jgi:hypothetical protein
LNKFFLLLLIGGLAVAYVLLTRPVPPETVGEEAAPAAGADIAAETMAPEPQASATTSAAPDTMTTHTVAPAEQSAPADESRRESTVETAIEDQAAGIADQVLEEARGTAEPEPVPTIDEVVDDTKTTEAPTVTGEAIEAAAPLAPPAPMAPAAATPDPSALPPDR